MPTDSERREVARRLRELNDSELQVYDMTYFAIQHAVGSEGDQYPDGRELADRLADLIEPPGYECVPGECPMNVRHDNDRIDRDALLALADEMEQKADENRLTGMMSICRARSWADRIREACGEVG